MENEENKSHNYGLVGKDISYSFSRGYFTEKFKAMGLSNYSYRNYDFEQIQDFEIIVKEEEHLSGLNVTIPYKEAVIPYLAALDPVAEEIGAVNTIKLTDKGLIGYNTDAYGFRTVLEPLLQKQHKQALILGTGGASKAIAYVLGQLNISFKFVSRDPAEGQLNYEQLDQDVMGGHKLIINCTPLGTFPDVERKPPIAYRHLTAEHLLFDLIYNPEKSAFLQQGEMRGATISNGLKMLQLQAEKAWEIWNS